MTRNTLHLTALLAVLLVGGLGDAAAQSAEPDVVDEHPFEVGAQLTFVGLNFPARITSTPAGEFRSGEQGVTTGGYGGRFGYNVNRYVALEVEVNHLPRRNVNEIFQNRREQIFAGLKVGRRWEKVGLFAKARPGAMHFDEYGVRGPCTFNPPSSLCFDQGRTFFAADVGGVVEYYPTRRTILRVDAGDTVVRFRDSGPITFPPVGGSPGSALFTVADTTHNFQMTFGFGFRF